ncbi:EamA family transporter [Ornithinicoccus hortensis]|uniref:O-acetylserine/cysteine efflux transporter n=1 Tax=Ornithinicoccus hortensis TaxID=82346 RepID=A0A542YPL9_9MICO|nr:EamA family transporter [Ornithinicoccus hortensis]TQL50045.1 O-acetylserine/cysteine efflux transporter [Ornithinicoccus hortensis]
MPVRHRLLAVSVALMWGVNFTAIHASLQHFPPFLLVALRFLLLAVPAVLFVPWPRVPVRWLVGYGIGFGTLQFLFLYWGMAAGMPVGLASLVLQASAPFTVLLGATFLRERISATQVVGILIAVGGLAIVGSHRAQVAAVLPFLLTLAGAFGWAIGNICNRQARPQSPLHLTMWMSVVPPLPMFAVSWVVEGPDRIWDSVSTAFTPDAFPALLGLAYTVLIGTVAGSGVWTWLMTRHPAGVVAPYSLLVPVAGMLSAWVFLGETVSPVELLGGLVVITGVLLGSVRLRRRRPPAAVGAPPGGAHAGPLSDPPSGVRRARAWAARSPSRSSGG